MTPPDIACYAVRPETACGRLHPEVDSPSRTPWQRDRDRVLHSDGFRRLQYKTQVFINHEGDFFRTRLTHSLEVAQIARAIARQLRVNEDLIEALALAHDMGHTPFGHAGEDALRKCLEDEGGFDHNTQSMRLVTKLEHRYHGFDGLNLTWETLEGLAKHNGPVRKPTRYLADYDRLHQLNLGSYASAEAQIAAMSDDIAYHGHDLDDGLKSGLICFEDLENLPVIGAALQAARAVVPQDATSRKSRIRHEMVRQIIGVLVTDLMQQSRQNLEALNPQTADDVRAADRPVIGFSEDIRAANHQIRRFLMDRLYRHWKVKRMTRKARMVTTDLFNVLTEDDALLPDAWRRSADTAASASDRRRVVADYIAGMTDRFAMQEHRRLTELSVLG
ncbi:MAG: deoxyguanosinetriphosphate triphosphohydrolase [Acetobacteraceae bacterium]